MPKKKRKNRSKKPSKKKAVKRKKISSKKKATKKKRKNSSKKTKFKKEVNKNLSSELIFKTKKEWVKSSLANKTQYQNKYNESIKNNNGFWKKEGKRITWIKPYKKIKDVKYSKDELE